MPGLNDPPTGEISESATVGVRTARSPRCPHCALHAGPTAN